MQTVWVRLNAVVFFGLTVLLGLSCMAAISKIGHSSTNQPSKSLIALWSCCSIRLLYVPHPPLSILSTIVVHKLQLRTLKSLKSHGGVDRALFSFDMHVDFQPAFHWNIKQLFTYVVASYETEDKKINQVVVHDKIIESIDPNKVLKYDNAFVKYALVDQGDDLRGKDITLSIMWDYMPITGLLYMGKQPISEASTFTLPSEYQ
jgi:signal peptidase complex subunit 3